MKVLVVNPEEVKTILDMKSAIQVMEDAFTMLKDGGLTPPRSGMPIAEKKVLGAMPAYLNGIGKVGIKVNTVFSGNSGSEYHIHQGAVLVFEDEHGCLEGIVDAAEITNVRTAASSGLATKLLANESVSRLSIIGVGTQGSFHLEAMLAVRDIKSVTVWDIDPGAARAFAECESKKYGLEIHVAKDAEEAVKNADLICISTPSKQPVLQGVWVAAGTHVNSVGFSGPSGRELDNALIKKSRVYVDCKESILHDCGDLLVPISEGTMSKADIVGDMTGLLTHGCEGRRSAGDITLYKSAGVSIQDLACAHFVYKEALKRGLGISINSGKAHEN